MMYWAKLTLVAILIAFGVLLAFPAVAQENDCSIMSVDQLGDLMVINHQGRIPEVKVFRNRAVVDATLEDEDVPSTFLPVDTFVAYFYLDHFHLALVYQGCVKGEREGRGPLPATLRNGIT